MKQLNFTFFECGLYTAQRHILFHNCDPYLVNNFHVLTSGSPDYGMETNKRILQSVVRLLFIEVIGLIDYLL